MPTWTRAVVTKDVGSFLIDAPMGFDGHPAWSLDQLVGVIRIIQATFTPPYSIIIYSLYGMGEVQRGLKAADEHQGGSSKEALQVTKFIMVKVSCDARLFLSINLQTCMFAETHV